MQDFAIRGLRVSISGSILVFAENDFRNIFHIYMYKQPPD